MQHFRIISEIDVAVQPIDNGERFLSQIRLFLAFRRGAGQDTERQEFLLDTLAEMHQTMNKLRTPIEVFSMPPIIHPASYEIEAR